MKIRHEHSGYFGPAPLHCPCCGKKEATSGCVRGFTCQCDWNWCKRCFKCSKHCTCELWQMGINDEYCWMHTPGGWTCVPCRLAITLPAFFAACSLFAKAYALESLGEMP